MNRSKDIKPHIGIFGRRNNGKSSLINILTGQDIAIVSEIAGTTTDPVKKSVEIFGIGPVIIVDTAGIDDSGELGEKRISKSLQVIRTIDLAVILIANNTFGDFEKHLIKEFAKFDVPYIIIHNKSDIEALNPSCMAEIKKVSDCAVCDFSARNPEKFDDVVELLRKNIPQTAYISKSLLGDIIKPNDYVLLVTPIDSEAPEGRMILPQQMAIRDVLDNNCICIVLRETELEHFFKTSNIKPALVITDSQAFSKVMKIVPEDIPLTGFSVVFARLKGDFVNYIKGTRKLSELKDNDQVLILESCTHHVSCEDIGRFKLPRWIKEFSGKNVTFDIVSGMNETVTDISKYALVVQCGGCMFTKKQISGRIKPFIEAGVPVTNYGMAIAYMNGIFERSLQPFLSEV
jgi:[FeFe] hydrogenase H-cluster maturation GTPase HydF